MELAGRTALVTGAARGIGRAIAEVLAGDGADVAVADVSPAVEETRAAVEALGRRSFAAVFDVSDFDAVTRGVAAVREALGELDILVNNAGIVDHLEPVEKMAPEAWDREVRVNLGGVFRVTRAVLPGMIAKGRGRIVNVSSVAAQGGAHHQAAYAASKAGVIGFTQTVAVEHGRHGITCNAILPGLIATENVRRMPDEIRDTFVRFTPVRRLGDVREIGYLVSFLASDRAAFINGAEIRIDGGGRLNSLPLGSRRELREILGR